jgi:glutamate N-acetyltransferase/amino-acid N-acetyltransferase
VLLKPKFARKNRRDLTLVALDAGCTVARCVHPKSFLRPRPVQLCRKHLAAGQEIRALVINTGIANAGTGEPGRQGGASNMRSGWRAVGGCCRAGFYRFRPGLFLSFLPVDRIKAGLPAAQADLKADNWHAAAHGIMTTDTVAKAASRNVTVNGKKVTISGVSKGAGHDPAQHGDDARFFSLPMPASPSRCLTRWSRKRPMPRSIALPLMAIRQPTTPT